KLSIWDVAGQAKFASFRDTFYGGAHAAALVYDVTAPVSFNSLMRWRDEIQSVVPHVPMVGIGNKMGLPAVVDEPEARKWARSLSLPLLLTSAATGERVEDLFIGLAFLAIQEQQRRKRETLR